MEEEIDIEALRRDLIDFFGSATPMFPVAYMDVIKVENATSQELIKIALDNHFNLDNYKVYKR